MADITDQTLDVNIANDGNTKRVTVTTDGAKERLDVDANITGGNFNLQPFPPKVSFNSAGVTVTSAAWVTLLTVSAKEGKLDFVGCAGSLSGYKIRLTVDATVIFTISMSDLSAIGLSNAVNVEMWAETADKNYRYHPNVPIDFTTDLKVEAQATGADVTLKYITHHREAT